jgi:predicted transcriptional regulator
MPQIQLHALPADESGSHVALHILEAETVIRVPSNYAAIYKKAVDNLHQHLAGGDASHARNAIRALIDKIIIRPSEQRQGTIAMELYGDLFGMLDFASGAAAMVKQSAPNGNGPQLATGGRMTPLVAGVGFEPTTFRL